MGMYPITQEQPMQTQSPLKLPTPDDIKSLLKVTRTSRADFASMLHVSKPTVDKWMAPELTLNSRQMPLASWELALIKLNRHPTLQLK
jgi:DNA-binding transcriptional regulator YiaG